ncbi:MAG: methyltransferase family protein [Actinomycetota bacterium]
MTQPRHVPSLGPRGEGWVALQVLAFVGVVLAVVLGPRWSPPPEVLAVVGAFAGAVGVTLVMSALLSLQQAGALTAFPRPLEGEREPLTKGPYALARHPIYGGLLLVVAAVSVWFPLAVVPLVGLAAIIRLKSTLEERWLLERYPRYAAYRDRVRHRLVPYVW